MELKQLRNFVRIADIGSFSKAAQVVHVAQSALSLQLSALEGELGVALFRRVSRGVVLTEAGERLYAEAQKILRHADGLKSAVADPRSIGGVVTLGLPLSVAAILALPIIQRAKATLPLVQLHMYELSSGTGAEWLASSRLDMCLLFQEHELSGISRTVLFDEVLFLLVQSASPLARRKSIPLREVAGMRLVLPTPGLGVRSLLEDECAKLGLRLANPAAELNSISLMKQATAAGLGPSVFGAAAFSGDPFASHLSALQIVRPSLPRRALLYTREAADNEAVERVADLARATVREVAANAGWRGVTVR